MTTTSTAQKAQLLIGGAWRDAADGRDVRRRQPGDRREAGGGRGGDARGRRRRGRRGSQRLRCRKMADDGGLATREDRLQARAAHRRARRRTLACSKCATTARRSPRPRARLSAIVDCFEFYAGAATKNYGETMPPPLPTYLANTVREPVGVVGAIVPWNFPLLLASWKVAPALAAGCTIVLKPAPSTPLSALELGKIALEAGVPEGVLNVVTGSTRELGAMDRGASRCRQDRVHGLDGDRQARCGERGQARSNASRSNSAESLRRSSSTMRISTRAVAGALYGIYYNAGQTCDARSRILVQSGVYDRFVAAFVESAQRICASAIPRIRRRTIGAITHARAARQDQGLLRDRRAGRSQRAFRRVRAGARAKRSPRGIVLESDRVRSAELASRRARGDFRTGRGDRTFRRRRRSRRAGQRSGVRPVARACGPETSAARIAWRARSAAGTVAINTPYAVFPGVPFGGYKQSGYGRELGMETMRLYSETKSVLTYHRREADGSVRGVERGRWPTHSHRRPLRHDLRHAVERGHVFSARHARYGRRHARWIRGSACASPSMLTASRSRPGKTGARPTFLAEEGTVEPPSRPLSNAVLSEARDVLSDAEDGCHLHLHDDEEVARGAEIRARFRA